MANEYTTPALVAAEIRASTAFSSSTIPTLATVTTWIQEASRQIELMSNNVFSSTTVSSQLFDTTGTTPIVNLPVSNVISIDKVEYNINGAGVAPSWVACSEGYDKDYITYNDYAEIEFVKGQSSAIPTLLDRGKQRLRLSYTYGFTTTPLEVEQLCTLLVAKRCIRSLASYQANTKMGEVTVGPVSVADPSMFSINYIKYLNEEIDRLQEEIALKYKTFKFSTRAYDTISGYGLY